MNMNKSASVNGTSNTTSYLWSQVQLVVVASYHVVSPVSF